MRRPSSPLSTPVAIVCDKAMPASAAAATSVSAPPTRRACNSGPTSSRDKKNAASGSVKNQLGRSKRVGAASMPIVHSTIATLNNRCRASPHHGSQPATK
jgi:hypothetical protein